VPVAADPIAIFPPALSTRPGASNVDVCADAVSGTSTAAATAATCGSFVTLFIKLRYSTKPFPKECILIPSTL
jgi:hypothetical protein